MDGTGAGRGLGAALSPWQSIGKVSDVQRRWIPAFAGMNPGMCINGVCAGKLEKPLSLPCYRLCRQPLGNGWPPPHGEPSEPVR